MRSSGRIKFNSVTWYSKFLTYLFIFGVFPVIIFNIGVKYHQTVEVLNYGFASASELYLSGEYDDQAFQGKGSFEARKDIEGQWVSNEDSSYMMNIKANNMIYEKHKNNVVASGSWIIRDALRGTKFSDMPDGLYLQKNLLTTDGEEQVMYYKIISMTDDALELVYLEKENTLTFKKQ